MKTQRNIKYLRSLSVGSFVLVCFLNMFCLNAVAAKKVDKVNLVLPPCIYVVPKIEMNIYFNNVVLCENINDYTFKVKCAIGKADKKKWSMKSNRIKKGTYPLTLKVLDGKSKVVAEGKLDVIVVPKAKPKIKKLNLLIVGDSLTSASIYATEIALHFLDAKIPKLTMLGSQQRVKKVKSKKINVAHEGYGGWTWKRFLTNYKPDKEKYTKLGSSPFIFIGKGKKPTLNISRYLKEKCDGKKPDLIIFFLGINDCFSAKPDDKSAMNNRFDYVLKNADKLIAVFKEKLPDVSIALCLTPSPNDRKGAFVANYKNADKCWLWKQIQHHLVQKMIEKYTDKQEKNKIFLIPTNSNIDTMEGYPEKNALHPNSDGYKQLADSMYCWIKWWMNSPFVSK